MVVGGREGGRDEGEKGQWEDRDRKGRAAGRLGERGKLLTSRRSREAFERNRPSYDTTSERRDEGGGNNRLRQD
jgi:hypothetical protein